MVMIVRGLNFLHVASEIEKFEETLEKLMTTKLTDYGCG